MAINIFGPTISMLEKVLDFRSLRHTITAANIANADTPHYKSVHVNFEDELEKALPPDDNRLKVKTTNENHFPRQIDVSQLSATIGIEPGTSERADGNTVDLDHEIVKMSKNQLMYSALSQAVGRKLRGLMSAIKEVT